MKFIQYNWLTLTVKTDRNKKMKVITIGRGSENDVVITDARVSRTHLQIVQSDSGSCSVVDLNSANGTFVNGRKITGEVHLQPHDVICIGNTTLPWQEYIKSSTAAEQKSMDIVRPTPKTNRIRWCIAACVVSVLFAVGIGFCFYCNGKRLEKIEAQKRSREEIRKEQLRQDTVQKAEEAKRLQDEADELFRQALISQSDKSKALAAAKQKEATEAKKDAEAAIAAQRKAEIAKIAAEKAKEEADRAKAAAEQNSKKAIRNAEEKADRAISEANTERDSANEKAKLTEKFYEEYAAMKSDFAKQVCTQLQYELPKDKNDAKTALKDLFNRSDNKGKQVIIDAMQFIKQRNGKTKVNESEVKSDFSKSSKNTETIDDRIFVKSDE